ncbi:MAG: phosphotransferase family protein [Candidatus Dormibacteria bacterium]
MTSRTALPGLDLPALAEWLSQRTGTAVDGLRGELIPGGRSNLTYRLGDASGRQWVVRRPPLANLLPTAHDMAREHRVMAALHGSVPVPRMVGLHTDPGLLGAPFLVMEYVAGHVLRERLPPVYPDTPATRRALSLALVETLARLHQVDPAGVGLADLGRPDGYLERQLRRWWTQWTLSATRELAPMETLRDALSAGLPRSGSPAIVHGDYRLDNLMYAPDSPERVVAVLDWEMCTLGDPLADLGLLLVYWADADHLAESATVPSTQFTAEAGFLTRDELVAVYRRRSGRELTNLDWYIGLGFFKLAVVVEGIHARHLAGMTVGDGFQNMGAAVPHLVQLGLQRLGAV